MTKDFSSWQRKRIITKALIFATLILVIFALIGEHILNYLKISLASFQIAGGLLLLIIAFELIFAFRKTVEKEEGVAFTSMAVPLIAGPGAIATVMIYTTQIVGIGKLLILLTIFLAMFSCWLVLYYTEYVLKIFKKEGARVLTKIMGLILAALAVEMISGGVKEIIVEINMSDRLDNVNVI